MKIRDENCGTDVTMYKFKTHVFGKRERKRRYLIGVTARRHSVADRVARVSCVAMKGMWFLPKMAPHSEFRVITWQSGDFWLE